MDVIVGKSGSFFVVRDVLDKKMIKTFSNISFDEFAKYRTCYAMKNISTLSVENIAKKNNLQQDILEDFLRYEEAVDYTLTQSLMYFIVSDDGRERSEKRVKINPNNYKNSFTVASPLQFPKEIIDHFQLQDIDVPPIAQSVGIALERLPLTSHVKWNEITYRVDLIPTKDIDFVGDFDHKSVVLVEYNYLFEESDWQIIKQIEQKVHKELKRREKCFFLRERTEDNIIEETINSMFKEENGDLVKYTRIYDAYMYLKELRHDYRSTIIYELYRHKNKMLLETRRLKARSKSLKAIDMYKILVEDKRSAALATVIDKINRYWRDGNWEEFINYHPCFAVLNDKPKEKRDELLQNMEFVVNVKLQYWNQTEYAKKIDSLIAGLPALIAQNSYSKGEDADGSEYNRQVGMLYTYRVYNPQTHRYEYKKLDKYIRVPVPTCEKAQKNIIDRAQYHRDRKKNSMILLMTKNGIKKALIWKAAKIYDAYKRSALMYRE